MGSAVNWFEIPVTDIHRAADFYSKIFDYELTVSEAMPGFHMAQLYSDPGTIGGALLQGEGYVPSADGALLYLNGGDDLQVVLDRVAEAGVEILMPKSDIGENGFMALFIDSEGNKIGLHSMG